MSKLACSIQQASSMILRHLTSLLSTLLPFWTCIITVGKWKWWRKKKLALVKFKFWLFINGDEIHRPIKIIFSLKNTLLQYLTTAINIWWNKKIFCPPFMPSCFPKIHNGGSPTYTKITNTVSTTTVFGLCMCKWGIFSLVGDPIQSH